MGMEFMKISFHINSKSTDFIITLWETNGQTLTGVYGSDGCTNWKVLPTTQTEIITHFPWEILRKMEIFIIDKQANAQNLLVQMTLHFSLG